MGANDAAEQLVEAKAEVVRLERENTRLYEALERALSKLGVEGDGDLADVPAAIASIAAAIASGASTAETGEWMLRCDAPGCTVRLPAIEQLRGTGEFGESVAREVARREGWTHDPVTAREFCRTHSRSGS